MENKQLNCWGKIKKIIFKKPVQYGLLFLWLTVVLTVFLSHFIHNIPRFVDSKLIVRCDKNLKKLTVVISDERFEPKEIRASVCDQITFINKGSLHHQPAFGPHPIHTIYPKFQEKLLAVNQSNSLLLTAAGTYYLHDHLNNSIKATLIITPGNL